MQQALDYPTESQIMALQPQEFVNIRQTQEQINLLRRIANAIGEDSSRSILSRLIILILLTCLYGWLTYDFMMLMDSLLELPQIYFVWLQVLLLFYAV